MHNAVNTAKSLALSLKFADDASSPLPPGAAPLALYPVPADIIPLLPIWM